MNLEKYSEILSEPVEVFIPTVLSKQTLEIDKVKQWVKF